MVFETLKKKLNISKEFYAVTIIISGEVLRFDVIKVEIINNEFFIRERITSSDFEELKAKISNNLPIVLNIDGEGIITKQVEKTKGYLQSIIFKSNPEDFYIFEYHQENQIFISLTRKKNIQAILENFLTSGFYVVNVSIGPYILALIYPLLNNNNTILNTSLYKIEFDNKKIKAVLPQEDSYREQKVLLNNEEFSEYQLRGLATLLYSHFGSSSIEFDDSFLNENREEAKHKKLYKIAGIFSLGFLLLAIIVGHFWLDFLSTKLANREAELFVSQQSLSTLNALKEEKNNKEKILLASGFSSNAYLTKYIYKISENVPEGITFEFFEVNPLLKSIKENEKIEFRNYRIIIKGDSDTEHVFNQWISELKTIKWISLVEIIKYRKTRSSVNEFELHLSLSKS